MVVLGQLVVYRCLVILAGNGRPRVHPLAAVEENLKIRNICKQNAGIHLPINLVIQLSIFSKKKYIIQGFSDIKKTKTDRLLTSCEIDRPHESLSHKVIRNAVIQ